MAQVRKAETPPPLNMTQKLKRQVWAKNYLKTDSSKILWTDEMRGTLIGPDGRPVAGSVTGTELHFVSDAARWRWGSGVAWYC